MSERRPRAGRVVGIAEGVAAAVRRRQREREPRVLVYDGAGRGRSIAPSAPGYEQLLEAADGILAIAGGRAREPRPRSSPRSRTGAEPSEPAA